MNESIHADKAESLADLAVSTSSVATALTRRQKATLDLTGHRFGRLLVIGRAPNHTTKVRLWFAKCDCGNDAAANTAMLLAGKTRSCGCLRAEVARRSGIGASAHGHRAGGGDGRDRRSRTYNSWRNMMARCRPDGKGRSHHRYAGRGIYVCDRWRVFSNFLADMGERPPGKTLDRYPNNDGNYEPGNCRWATPKEQAENRKYPKKERANANANI